MLENGFPNAKFKLMDKVHHKYQEVVESKGAEPLNKDILQQSVSIDPPNKMRQLAFVGTQDCGLGGCICYIASEVVNKTSGGLDKTTNVRAGLGDTIL